MNNNNYLFYRKYFDFEKSNLSRQECINEILEFNNDLNNQELENLNRELNWINNNGELIKRRNIENLKFINKSILKSQLINVDISDCGNSSISLSTTYPGLLLGTGYSHDYKAGTADEVTQEGFKIGFYFDFTTGMPVIPGTSLKGKLRSCFPQSVVASKNGKNKKPKYSKEKVEFIKEELKNLGITEEIDIDIFEREIFDGLRPQINEKGENIKDEKGKLKFKPFSIYKRDVFFEAIPMAIHNSKNVLFEDDALAVHKENLLKNPTPIKFLKVASNIEYQFQFKLFPSEIYFSVTAEIKRKLFEVLIINFGIGAKTNVGYGQFVEVRNNPTDTGSSEKKIVPDKNKPEDNPPVPRNENVFPKGVIPFLKKNKCYEGIVVEIIDDKYEIHFDVNEFKCIYFKKKNEKLQLNISDIVTVICSNDYKPDNPNISIKKL